MKKTFLLLVMMYCLVNIKLHSQTLIWADEFNGTELDQNNWNYETGTGLNGDWGTCQVDAATDRPENVSILQGISDADGGVVAITTTKENYVVPGGGGTRQYTSGRINTQGKVSWGPGHQIKARIWAKDVRYVGQGFAFWAMPNELPQGETHLMWPQGGEIDIFEYNGLNPYNNLGSVHYANWWNNNQWMDGNHVHHGGIYSYESQQVPGEQPQWIYVDLGQSYNITRVVLNWEFAYASHYQIQVSDDAINWIDVFSTSSGTGGVDDISLSGNGRYVRMLGTERGTQYGYSLWEFEVYESGANLALNKPVVSSSNENSSLGTEFAVDGSSSTRWASGNLEMNSGPLPPALDNPNTASYTWHEYGINWYDDRLEFFADDNVYHIHYFNDGGRFTVDGQDEEAISLIDGKRTLESEYSNRFSEWHPFEHNFYLILSAGVGGSCTYGGAIVDDAIFPCSVYVDWIRVYDLNGGSNSLPTATYTYTANDLIVDFDGSGSSDSDGSITSWTWDFGNGNTANGQTVNHTYAAAGNYTVTLSVTDDAGGTDSESKVVSVSSGGSGDPVSVHVQSIITGTQDAGRGSKQGTATVTIHNDLEGVVSDAMVTGTFSGSINETVSGVTDVNGTVILTTTSTAKGKVSVDFCVDNVTHSSLSYNNVLNDITCSGELKNALLSEEEVTEPFSFNIYPNPVIDLLNIEIIGDDQEAKICIYDISGKQVYTTIGTSNNYVVVNMSDFDAGIYLIRVSGKNGVKTERIIKR
ncbi:T9SS type A sorting domain-containing protein [Labilibacter sediminis]|nr:T9SS type A sorting domain-containing protein [Labilibacter sediminis]